MPTKLTRRSLLPLLALCLWPAACLAQVTVAPRATQPVARRWDFKFKDFVIGAWWGPSATEAEMKVYKEAGFNVVMSGRYMQLDSYGDADKGLRELDLARKYGLGVMFDTYTKNDRPWGGKAGPTDQHSVHHPASLIELQWLYDRIGRHPALAGFMIGDDQGSVSDRAAACTDFLYRQSRPQLMPWLCGWIAPQNLAQHNNPIADPQIYPTLYQWSLPAPELARQYAATYARFSRQCREQGVLFWPMLNTSHDSYGKTAKDMFGYCPSDSLVRFPAYAALAYGAQGLWYFTYNGGALQHLGDYHTEAAVRGALTPLYPVVQRVNQRIAAWGPRVLGRTATGLFGTAFHAADVDWPFPDDASPSRSAEDLARPAGGKLIEGMSDGLLAGVLTAADRPPLVMVVDCRASKNMGDLKPRTVSVRFGRAVRAVNVLEAGRAQRIKNREVTLTLEPGGGQMLELVGRNLGALCAEAAIYALPRVNPEPIVHLTAADLPHIKAARLRIDVFGSNGGRYAAKYIYLNGHRLAQVPANDVDEWSPRTIALAPDQLPWLQMANEVTVRTEVEDAWKFRRLTLAVQRADGAWARSDVDTATHSSPGWAYSEGQSWGKDGVAGPIPLAFR